MKKLIRILWLLAGISWSLSASTLLVLADLERKPNIVLIMADDVSWECFGCYGGEDYQTPRIDSLAASGIRFNHCYSTPICTTSRVQIMTGKYNFRNYTHFGYLAAATTSTTTTTAATSGFVHVTPLWFIWVVSKHLNHRIDTSRNTKQEDSSPSSRKLQKRLKITNCFIWTFFSKLQTFV